MPFKIVRNDITKMKVDAIVNAANNTLLGGGGVDGTIHAASGPKLLEECKKLGGCETGQAKITGAYNLPSKYVIHAVGPRWQGGEQNEKQALESCYRTSLYLAAQYNCESIAFPLISSGIYGYPKEQAFKVAMDTIRDFLLEHEMDIYLVVFDKQAYSISEKLFTDIVEYIDNHYVEEHTDDFRERMRMNMPMYSCAYPCDSVNKCMSMEEELEEKIKQLDESFCGMLFRLIDKSGMSDVECYKKANIDRKLFSKIRSNLNYKPSKQTAIAFAIALELDIEETEELLKKAGFALSYSNAFDIIIRTFIDRGYYDIFDINATLFHFDQNLLGS